MEIDRLIEHYKMNHEYKVFMTRLSHSARHAYIMYIYNYPDELRNFAETFLVYLPFYVRNSDYFESLDENEDLDTQLITRSKSMRRNSKVIPRRNIASDGIYGEMFLDFYLRIVNARKAIITYANKRSFDSNYETTGPDNVVYFLDENGKINICFCEAKFVAGASTAKTALVEDIIGKSPAPGKKDGKPSHVSASYLNDYFQFIVEKGHNIQEPDKTIFKDFLTALNSQLDNGDNFVSVLIMQDICVNFIFFAIFDSTKKTPHQLEAHYNEIYNQCEQKVKTIGFSNYNIEIVFIPTDDSTMNIKQAMEKSYE